MNDETPPRAEATEPRSARAALIRWIADITESSEYAKAMRLLDDAFLEAEAAQGAAPRAEGLDVERLARALANLRGMDREGTGQGFGWPGFLVQGDPSYEADWRTTTMTQAGYAAAIEREYTRLSRPSDEVKP